MKFDAIVFDFDGVLVESADIKTRAFGRIYERYGQEIRNQVIEYHLAHAGLSRYEKFRVWQEEYLGLPYTEEVGEHLSSEFSRLVLKAIVDAPFVRGAKEFLEQYHKELPLFIASGTPESELREIVFQRNMSRFFSAVFGSPHTKGEILSRIMQSGNFDSSRLVMIGDSISDFQGAREAGVAFIGRISQGGRNAFPKCVRLLRDLTALPSLLLDDC